MVGHLFAVIVWQLNAHDLCQLNAHACGNSMHRLLLSLDLIADCLLMLRGHQKGQVPYF